MGEFLILLALSKFKLDNKQIWQTLIKEYFARQFSWIIDKFVKENKANKEKISSFNIINYPHEKCFNAAKVSNHLLIFNFVALLEFLNERDIFC